jgi:hypothetical protein
MWVTNNGATSISRCTTDGRSAGSVLVGHGLASPKGITVVGTQAWMPNDANSTISRFNADGSSAGSPLFGNGLSGPRSGAAVGSSQVWIPNNGVAMDAQLPPLAHDDAYAGWDAVVVRGHDVGALWRAKIRRLNGRRQRRCRARLSPVAPLPRLAAAAGASWGTPSLASAITPMGRIRSPAGCIALGMSRRRGRARIDAASGPT